MGRINISESESRVQRLWLVRHGSTVWNSEKRLCGSQDIPLSALGEQQAEWVARQLSGVALSAIYTSDLSRTQQTAAIIAKRQAVFVSMIPVPVWREISFGKWEGLTYAQIAQQFPDEVGFFTDPLHFSPPDGESFLMLLQRVKDGFAVLIEEINAHSPGDIVLVSHGGLLRVLLCWLLSLPFEQQWRLVLDNGSLSAIDFVPTVQDVTATVTLALFNMHSHLVSP